jgi:hypothetical protein
MNQNSYLDGLRRLILMTTVAEDEGTHKPPKSDFRVFNEEVRSKPDEIDLGFDFGPWKLPSLLNLIHRNRNQDE